MNSTLSKHEIKYYRNSIESQTEALSIEIRNQRLLKEDGSEDALKILEGALSQAEALFSSWNAVERLFYPEKEAESA